MTERIRLDTLIEEIALLVYPDDDLRAAKKKMRDAFRHSPLAKGKNGSGQPTVARRDAEIWAAEKWPLLRSRFQVATVASIEGRLPSLEVSATGVQLPTTHDELVEQYIALSGQLIRIQEELALSRASVARLEQEAAERRVKDDETRKKRSAAGKQGGRGNWGGGP